MKITNSVTGKKEEFVPIVENEVKMYACGVTVYDLSHIGHARQAITYRMMADYFKYKGYKVTYVRNYTDVDDKIINRANELGKDALEFSKEQIEETVIDMKNLNVEKEDITTKASEYIGKIIEFIGKLIEKGYAYALENGDVYFSVSKFANYGKLSHRKVEDLLSGVRKEVEEGKRENADFALWKSIKPGEIYWESPWGKGRPGWHIECSAMALDTLGQSIDIHGGGRDLMFPHHENEIAQTEALTGKEFAKYWSHCGLIKINGEKMSKSLGNALSIREALEKYNYEVIKYTLFTKHYSSDINITDDDFKNAEKQLYYFYNTIKEMKKFESIEEIEIEDEVLQSIESKFEEAMEDDFNTAAVISNLHIVFKHLNGMIAKKSKSQIEINSNVFPMVVRELKRLYKIIDLLNQDEEKFIEELKTKYMLKLGISESEIEDKIVSRVEAKKEKNFDKADEIRIDLDNQGIILQDTPNGTTWDIKALYNI